MKAVVLTSIDSLLEAERTGVLSYQSMSREVTYNSMTFQDIIHIRRWLHKAAVQWDLAPETFFACTNVLDAYMSRANGLTRQHVYSLAAGILSICCKYQEVTSRSTSSYVAAMSYSITADQIIAIERSIFVTLGCNINLANDAHYLAAISHLAGFVYEVEKQCKILLIIVTLRGINYLPSVTATAIVKLVSQAYSFCSPDYFGIGKKVINACCLEVVSLCNVARTDSYYLSMPEYVQALALIPTYHSFRLTPMYLTAPYLRSYYYKKDLNLLLVDPSIIMGKRLGSGSCGVVTKVDYRGTNYAVKSIVGSSGQGLSSS